ncbi:hypothetical protein CVT91_16280 [Candidatus Atribacteria bacterium HGW-Atribacteria-1]|nr:MAG: hypothetical protein CVT91_16280 [Candidatus Atribacteria bacterium HGW-Atribacteria-1]
MHRAHRKNLGNNIARAQFIVPLQPSYKQQIQNYYKIIYDTLCIYSAFKYFLAFWGNNRNISILKYII